MHAEGPWFNPQHVQLQVLGWKVRAIDPGEAEWIIQTVK